MLSDLHLGLLFATHSCIEMQLNTNIQLCTTSGDRVRDIFLKQPISTPTKSNDLNCLLLIGHASKPYNSTGRYLTFNSSTVTSSEATPATFSNTALKPR